MRYFIELAYKGTNYHGWQYQKNAKSVQETVEKAFSLILREKISIAGAGRTDSGVHALHYTAHFDTENKIENTNDFVYKLNSLLEQDIAIYKVYETHSDNHSRFSPISRTYEYHINTTKNPFVQESSYYLNFALDYEKMNQAAQKLFNYIDFTSFSKLHTERRTNNCNIYKAEWIINENKSYFIISANRFLRNMVRAIVGTLLEVGKGKLSIDDFCEIIESKDRAKAGYSVPARGLFLTKIKYPE